MFLHLSDCGQHTPRVGDLVRFMIERPARTEKGREVFTRTSKKETRKLVETSALLVVTGALLVVTRKLVTRPVPLAASSDASKRSEDLRKARKISNGHKFARQVTRSY